MLRGGLGLRRGFISGRGPILHYYAPGDCPASLKGPSSALIQSSTVQAELGGDKG